MCVSVCLFVCMWAYSKGFRGLLGPPRGRHRGRRSHHNGKHPPSLLILLSCQMAHTQTPSGAKQHTRTYAYLNTSIVSHKHTCTNTPKTYSEGEAFEFTLNQLLHLKQNLLHYGSHLAIKSSVPDISGRHAVIETCHHMGAGDTREMHHFVTFLCLFPEQMCHSLRSIKPTFGLCVCTK